MNAVDMIPADQALRVYPALAGLLAIIGAGWRFREICDDNGITALYGNRQYRHVPYIVDALKIRDETDASGLRGHNPDGLLWQMDGGLLDVVDGLLSLPDPASSLSPHLIVGAKPRLWVP